LWKRGRAHVAIWRWATRADLPRVLRPGDTGRAMTSSNDLPVMPGPEKPLLHIAIEFVETLDNTLAEHQMLNIAHGEMPAEAACIFDVPIDAVGLPDPTHPQYGSALVKRLEIQREEPVEPRLGRM
jgi:hypothetical protein